MRPRYFTQTQRASWQLAIGVLVWASVLSSLIVVSLRYIGTDDGLRIFNPGFGYIVCFVGILIYACYDCRDARSSDVAWNWIAVAWFLMLLSVVHGFKDAFSFSTSDMEMIALLLQRGFYLAVVSSITLPLLLTGPAMITLAPDIRSLSTGMTRWIYCSLAAAFLDAVLCVILVSLAFGTWTR